MDALETRAMMDDVASVMKALVSSALAPVMSRLAELEGRLNSLPKAVDPADIERRIEAVAAHMKASAETAKAEGKEKRKAALADLKAGILADCETIVTEKTAEAIEGAKLAFTYRSLADAIRTGIVQPDIKELVDEAIAAKVDPEFEAMAADMQSLRNLAADPLLTPTQADVAKQITEAVEKSESWFRMEIDGKIAAAVEALPPAEKGADADPELVASLVKETVELAVAAMPVPLAAEPLTADDVRPMVEELVAKVAAGIRVPKDGADGADVVDLLIDREGNLVASLSNGRTKTLGPVIGKDGSSVDMAAVERSIAEKVAALPKPKDGVDGFGFEDMTEELADDGRTIIRRYSRGDQVKEFRHTMSVVLDRGVFKEGQSYVAGDGATFGGHYWIARQETTAKPGTDETWRMAVRKGRDGKDGGTPPSTPRGPVKVG